MRNTEHDFLTSIRIGERVLSALSTHMRVRSQPHDFGVLEEGDLHRGRFVVVRIRWNRERRSVRGSEHGPVARGGRLDDRRILARALNHKLFRWRRLRYGETDFGAVHNIRTIYRVVKTDDDVRSGRHELSRFPRAIVVVAGAGQ